MALKISLSTTNKFIVYSMQAQKNPSKLIKANQTKNTVSCGLEVLHVLTQK